MPPIILDPAPLGPPAALRAAADPSSSSSSPYAFQTKPHKSVQQRRATYYAVKTGHRPGVYETWDEAERMIKGHPAPQFKAFKTYMAAEAFVAGRDGSSFVVARRPNVPLNEHLKSFPPSTPLSSPTPSPAGSSFAGPSTRQRRRAEPSTDWSPTNAVSPLDGPLKPPRPAFARSRTSSSSPIRRSSPLRQEVTDDEAPRGSEGDGGWTSGSDSDSLASPGDSSRAHQTGWLSPPTSPETSRAGARTSLQRPMAAYVRPSSPSAEIPAASGRPTAPRTASSRSTPASPGTTAPPAGGLWADVVPLSPPTSPLKTAAPDGEAEGLDLDLATDAPKFSRSAMKRNSNVVMPVSAKAKSPTASRPGSRLVSPRTSHGDLKAAGMMSLGAGPGAGADRRSLPTGRSLKALHEKLVALSSPSRDDLQDPLAESPESLRPKMSALRTLSSGSIVSIISDASEDSFVSATSNPSGSRDGHSRLSTITESAPPVGPSQGTTHLAVPSGLSITPLTPATQTNDPDAMSPLTLATSSQSSHGGSVATHVQSEHASGKFGRRKGSSSSSSSSGIGKKIMKVFGFSSKSESKANQTRRASN